MNTIVKIINKIANTSSTNGKFDILKSNKDNTLLQKILKYTYDDKLMYGISESVIVPYIVEFSTYDRDIFDLLDRLAYSNINDELRKEVGLMLGSLPQEQCDLILKVLTKDLRCGISTKTIQKIWRDLIPKWEIQQAYPLDKVKLKSKEWIALSEKLNGSRGSFLNGGIKSRQNKVFLGLEHIINDIKSLELDDYFIDGELIRNNFDGVSDNENFRLSMSLLSSDTADKSSIIFRIYDIVPKDEFILGESKLKYPDRIKKLEWLSFIVKEKGLKNVEVLPILYQGNDHSQIQKWLQWADDNNKEGVMLYRDSTYKCKRHNGILKVKSFKHCDVRCLRIETGTGKNENTLGSIVVNYKGFECGVGSGFTDSERDYFYNNPKEIIGKIVQVKFKEESRNKNDEVSMQFPIFECVRNDKSEESYN